MLYALFIGVLFGAAKFPVPVAALGVIILILFKALSEVRFKRNVLTGTTSAYVRYVERIKVSGIKRKPEWLYYTLEMTGIDTLIAAAGFVLVALMRSLKLPFDVEVPQSLLFIHVGLFFTVLLFRLNESLQRNSRFLIDFMIIIAIIALLLSLNSFHGSEYALLSAPFCLLYGILVNPIARSIISRRNGQKKISGVTF